MKQVRTSISQQELFSFQRLLLAYYQCQKHKRLKKSSAEFEFNMESRIIALEKTLNEGMYKPLPFSVFVVKEPKIREIFAANFRDRIIHHLIVSYLQPIFEPKFIHDSFANRVEKGTHYAIKRLTHFLRKSTKNNTQKTYYLQADIKNFFPSIKHDILFALIKKHVKNPHILWLTKTVIYHDCTQEATKKGQLSLFSQVPLHKSLYNTPKGQGLPIGNLTSQFFANIYLNELDQYIKHHLKCRYYIRYVDDFIILDNDKEKLHRILEDIRLFLWERLELELHPDKSKIGEASKGIDALGYLVKPTYKIVRRRVVKSLKKKLLKFQWLQKTYPESLNLEFMVASINSYYTHFCHAKSYKLRKHLWEEHFGELRKYLKPINDYRYFKLKASAKF